MGQTPLSTRSRGESCINNNGPPSECKIEVKQSVTKMKEPSPGHLRDTRFISICCLGITSTPVSLPPVLVASVTERHFSGSSGRDRSNASPFSALADTLPCLAMEISSLRDGGGGGGARLAEHFYSDVHAFGGCIVFPPFCIKTVL